MTEDIIARIDEAVGCQGCGKKLREDGPSPDFCSEDCQRNWMAKRLHHAGRGPSAARVFIDEVDVTEHVESVSVEFDEIPHGWLSRWLWRHR